MSKIIERCHENPKATLNESRAWNHYDYMLDYLWDDEEYKDFFKESLKLGRRVIFDNSLFEFHPYVPPMDRFYEHIKEMGQYGDRLEYIVTDVLNDADDTIKHFDEWMEKYSDAPGKSIGVAQGSTLEDLTRCYLYMCDHADKVAIPFDSAAFDELASEKEYKGDNLLKWRLGRPRFVKYLIDNGYYRSDVPIHLLGASYVREFENPIYRDTIETVDTSNPVVCGIKHIQYGPDGNHEKPSIKLVDLIDYKPTALELKYIRLNVLIFNEILN